MGKIGKISPIKKKFETYNGQVESLGSALAARGLTMFPGVFHMMTPFRERNGSYRTGLDPEALYIKDMSPEEAAQEKQRVTDLREQLEQMTGLDLSPNSSYYAKVYDSTYGDVLKADVVKLVDGPNTFNLADPQSAITFAWVRVHPEIAPSFSAWEKGKSTLRNKRISECKFFVDDEDYESEVVYKQKTLINKAINLLDSMSPTRQLKIAKLLNLPVSYTSKPETIYNTIDSFIKDTENGGTNKSGNIASFNAIANMTDENIEVRFKVKEAKDFNIYRHGKGGKLYDGEVKVADNEEELVEFLSSPKNQDDYLALQKRIDSAKTAEL